MSTVAICFLIATNALQAWWSFRLNVKIRQNAETFERHAVKFDEYSKSLLEAAAMIDYLRSRERKPG